MNKVIFVDIDDVLLSARALVLRNNRRFLKAQGLTVDARLVTFDPIGIEMLNRAAELTDAQLVLSTSWRYSIGVAATLDALQRNGLSASRMHMDPFCPLVSGRADGAVGKARDIIAWLELHDDIGSWVAFDNDPELPSKLSSATLKTRGLGHRLIKPHPDS